MCLSVREHIFGIALAIFTEFFVQLPCGRGSVLLRRRCDVLPVLWMTSRLAVMGATPKRGGYTLCSDGHERRGDIDVYE